MIENMRLATLSVIVLLLGVAASALANAAIEPSKSQIVAALQNVMTLDRPAQGGRLFDRSFRCESAGTLMQPSLEHVLVPERIS